MTELISFAVNALSFLALIIVLAIFAVIPITGAYLMSQEVREMIHDFQMWAARRRERKAFIALFKQRTDGAIMVLPDAPGPNATIFEQTAYSLGLDSRDILRSLKEQDAADQEILDRATEYRNDFTG